MFIRKKKELKDKKTCPNAPSGPVTGSGYFSKGRSANHKPKPPDVVVK